MGMSWKLKLLLWATNTFSKIDFKTISAAGFRDFADNRESSLLDGPPLP